ncbi:MAG: hypothetical protein IJS32_07145 [Kiritimatiellae bacterium]|nr:hypothetical protein [Kiritimatiellia bacterium]
MPLFDTTTIAIVLAAFFLVAAFINTLVNRARRRKIENRRAAQTGGGTEEAPIHLTTPFSEGQAAAPAAPAATPGGTKDQDDTYVWE